MRKTIIAVFYNEEYLLPWWLNHHKQYFDHGILINYASTDNSVNIIKDICPTWEIVESRNKLFGAKEVDDEVTDIETRIDGWKICLNVTEFLTGDYSILDETLSGRHILPCCVMVDNEPDVIPDPNKSLVKQKTFGMHYNEGASKIRRSRIIHNKRLYVYPLGRHFDQSHTTDKLVVLWYGFSPYNQEIIKRKLQIQNRIPVSDFMQGFGTQHKTDENSLKDIYQNYILICKDLSQESFMNKNA